MSQPPAKSGGFSEWLFGELLAAGALFTGLLERFGVTTGELVF
jgi:hypothetical protein